MGINKRKRPHVRVFDQRTPLSVFTKTTRKRISVNLSTDQGVENFIVSFEKRHRARLLSSKEGDIVDVIVFHPKSRYSKDVSEKVFIDANDCKSFYHVGLLVRTSATCVDVVDVERGGRGEGLLDFVLAKDWVNRFKAGTSERKEAIRRLESAKDTFLREKYSSRGRQSNIYEMFWEGRSDSSEKGDFAIVSYEHNTFALWKKPYIIVASDGDDDDEEYRVGFPEIELLRHSSTPVSKLKRLSRCGSLSILTKKNVAFPEINLQKKGETYYVVQIGAGTCTCALQLFKDLREKFPEMKVQFVLIDKRFRFRAKSNQYAGTIESVLPSSIPCNRITQIHASIKKEQETVSYPAFSFYKLDYFDDMTYAFWMLRKNTLLVTVAPDCAPFSIANTTGERKRQLIEGIAGVYMCLSAIVAMRPLMFVFESSGSSCKRAARKQSIVKALECYRKQYTHCKFIRKEEVCGAVNPRWIKKLTDTWSNLDLALPSVCSASQPCACYEAFKGHFNIQKLSTPRKAMWPAGFIRCISAALIERLSEFL